MATPGLGSELWKSDLTSAGTALVKDINPGADGSHPAYFLNHNGTLFFAANDGTNGDELWKSDGTSAGTALVKDLDPFAGSYPSNYPGGFLAVNGEFFFGARSSGDDDTPFNADDTAQLWKSDGSTAGTVLVKDFGVGSAGVDYLTNVGGTIFGAIRTSQNGNELWKSDGTSAGTNLVKDINTTGGIFANSYPSDLIDVDGTLFFSADDGINGRELWKSDGTAAGTVLVKDIAPSAGGYGASSSSPSFFANVNGTVYFAADDEVNGSELWKSDGTDAGTVLVRDIHSVSNPDGSYPYGLSFVNGRLYFSADDGEHGFEPWVLEPVTGGDPDEIVVDNDDATGVQVQGPWFASTFSPGFVDADYLVNRAANSGKVTFTPTLAADGKYQVAARWTSDPNRASNAPITVVHRDSSSQMLVNQQQSGGQWVVLGDFNLLAGAGHNVMVGTQGANGVVIADAVQFVRVGDVDPLPEPSDEIVVDNDDATGVQVQGPWFASTFSPGFVDADYLFNRAANSGKVTFTPSLAEDGKYEVSARWTSDANRASNAPITVVHRDGSSKTLVNQQQSGGQWVALGEFDLLAGAGHNVMVGTQGANGVVIADAVQFLRVGDVDPLPEPSDEIVLDNGDATGVQIEGPWFASTFSPGFIDADYLFNRAANSGKVTFTPPLSEDGKYEVSARWTSDSNRASNAPVTVVHRDGTAQTLVNQQQSGGQWVVLGEFNLLAGANHNVMVGTQGADGVVIADAVQFVRVGDVDPPPEPSDEIVVDNDDAVGVQIQGPWLPSTFSPGFFDADYLYNRAAGANKVTFTPAIAVDGLYEVSARWTSDPNRATNAPITIVHDGGSTETLVNQRQDGAQWVELGEFNLLAGAGHNVMVGTQGANGIVIADAVRFVRMGEPIERGTLSVIAVGDLTTTESGASFQLQFTIDAQPTADVVIPLSLSDDTEASLSAGEIRFTPTDFANPKLVTVTGKDDSLFDNDVSYTIVTGAAQSADPAYNGLSLPNFTAVNEDDEAGSFDGLYQGQATGTAIIPGVGLVPVDVDVAYNVAGLGITVNQPTNGTGAIDVNGNITFGVVNAPEIGSCDFGGGFVGTGGDASADGTWTCANIPDTNGGTASGTWQADKVTGEPEGEGAADWEAAVDQVLTEMGG